MITISHMSKVYKDNILALRDLNLNIHPGGVFGLLGPNGAGKTTLMRILAGLISATQGEVSVFGNDMNTPQGKQTTKELLGYLPQESGSYPDLTAREFLDYIAILKGITDRSKRAQDIDRVLEVTGLADVANRKIATFSGGMKRRVELAQALLGTPRLLIVDEPTSGLDPEGRVAIRNLLAEIAAHCTVILSTHIVEDINHACASLAILHEGDLLYQGTPGELVGQVRGRVWAIQGKADTHPNDGLVIVSTRQMPDGPQYRVLGDPDADYVATAAEPTLEDAYLWLMHQARTGNH